MESLRREDAKITVLDPKIEMIGKTIVESALHVHRFFGPGLLESIYEESLYKDLSKKNVSPLRQVSIPIYFDGELLDSSFRADMIVDQSVLIEVKACETLLPIHRAQTLSYLRVCNLPLGFLINFNVPVIKNGIVRVINDRFAPSRLCDSSAEIKQNEQL